ncbi:MAG: polyamine ABC transporter substrate-binding protein [Steroidobacteraceae bacterium]|nr:polyamine ABC transporter substrate-binding protein [Steroidobacteraceae bacterium]
MSYRSALLATTMAALLVACGGEKKPEGEAAAPAAPAPEEKVLNVYNWSDYIAEDTVPTFSKDTGIKVNYDVFDSNEVLETKLLAGRTGYDVVVPSASFLERQIKAGVFLKLDKSKLPNLKNMDPEIMQRVALHDPNNEHSIPYMWGTTGIGYDVDKVKKALGTDKVDSWAIVFDPKNAAKLKDCGITMLDAPSEVIDSALIYLGKDPNSESEADLKAAEELLMKVRPYVRSFNSSAYIDSLANGDICVAIGWSGDVLQARDRAKEAGKGVTVAYSIPKEGAIMWFDMLAIPADAAHPDNAYQFINYLMDPKVVAAASNVISYANGNLASLEFVDPAVKGDPAVYPDAAVKAKLHPHLAESQEFSRLMNRSWTRFTTGQ